ncbi:MAG: DUF2314 domain-containing protein [Treponema sp.]|nr:DUF2314 domain-containing protein [Treponema sp.]
MREAQQLAGTCGICLLLLCLFSCGRNSGTRVPKGELTAHQESADQALEEIAREARETLPDFLRRLRSPRPGDGNFRVKYPFPAGEGNGFAREQLWLRDISFEEGSCYGVLSNSPYYTNLKKKERVSIDIDRISDWMYTRNGFIEGGRSIRYLLEQIPLPDRTEGEQALLDMFR